MTEIELTLLWHGPEEVSEEMETIVVADPENDDMYISYGGGQIDRGWWAYARDLFCKEMMEIVTRKEDDLRAWLRKEREMATALKED